MADNGRKSNHVAEQLPADRQKAVEAGLAHYQLVSAERDKLMGEVSRLQSENAALKVVAEAQKSQLIDADSRIARMQAVRDEAVSYRAAYETFFAIQMAQLRAFKIPAVPLIKELNDEEVTHPTDPTEFNFNERGGSSRVHDES
jgi:hypothetical protein